MQRAALTVAAFLIPAGAIIAVAFALADRDGPAGARWSASPAATPGAERPASPAAGASETPATITVLAALPWTDTGLDVAAGAEVILGAAGGIASGDQTGIPPTGLADCAGGDDYLAPGQPCLALLARLGTGPALVAGPEARLTSPEGGRLYLGVNDSLLGFGDNTGSWTVVVTVQPLVPAGTVIAAPPVVAGTPAVPADTSGWPVYENSALGLLLRYPAGWTVEETPDRLSVTFRPQGADLALPGPAISFVFLATRPFAPDASPPPGTTDLGPVVVAGVAGRAYQDAALAIPTQTLTIELPHQGGTLLIATTIGPEVDLRAVLTQMLGTVRVLSG